MSGPIVRKYGFPNHESIFGKKEIEHGADDSDRSDEPTSSPKSSSGGKSKAEGKSEKPAGKSGKSGEKKKK